MTDRDGPGADRLFAAVDATWPPHRLWQQDGWTFRDGRGGGKRVSAATLAGSADTADIGRARGVMAGLGQPDLFMIRPQDAALDRRLEAAGYAAIDPVALLAAPIAGLRRALPVPSARETAEPTSEMAAVWAAGGIGTTRLDIMRRCTLPKVCIALQHDGETAAVAYAAIDAGLAMCHSVEVLKEHRRLGLGRAIMDSVTVWAGDHGADRLCVLCTRENAGALALYRGMGMTEACGYHYRIKTA